MYYICIVLMFKKMINILQLDIFKTSITLDDLRLLVAQCLLTKGDVFIFDILEKYGVQNIKDLKQKDYKDFHEKITSRY